MILYHGSTKIIKKPIYHGGKQNNDYGYGFYCTEDISLAKEWSCSSRENNGYVNKFDLNLDGLEILDLTRKEYTVLNWIAILLKNRNFDVTSDIEKSSKEYILNNFYIDVNQYDVVIGYRADDSYFRYAKDFINNTISVQKLSLALRLGNLGNQVVLISKKAHDEINYLSSEEVDSSIYYDKRMMRDEQAREEYSKSKENILSGKFIRDIMKEGLKHGDKII